MVDVVLEAGRARLNLDGQALAFVSSAVSAASTLLSTPNWVSELPTQEPCETG
jgi:hypothetical protein